MKLLTALLGFTLLSLSGAWRRAPQLAPQLESEDCSLRDLQAGLALDEINKVREDGYIFSLFRVADAHSQRTGFGNIYYLTIDVVETDCSVLSGKLWKDCAIRHFHETVFGQCKAVIFKSLSRRKVNLYSYNCTLSTVPPGLIAASCPDCPIYEMDITPYEERAKAMTDKYNKESNNPQYFMVEKIEKVSMQWVFDAAYFFEFTIRETNCSKLAENVSDCEFLDDEKAHVGLCKGRMFTAFNGDGMDVSCEIYDPKVDPDCPHDKLHGRRPGHRKHGRGHGHRHGHGKGHRHHHHRHEPHGNNQTASEERKHWARHSERTGQRKGGRHGKKHGREHEHGHGHRHIHPHHHAEENNHTSSEEGRHRGRYREGNEQTNGERYGTNHGRRYEHGYGYGVYDRKHKKHPSHKHKPSDSSLEERKICKPTADPVGSVQLVHLISESDVFPIPSIPDHPKPTASPRPSTDDGLGSFDSFWLPQPLPFPLVPSNSTGCPAEPKHQVEHIAHLLPVPK